MGIREAHAFRPRAPRHFDIRDDAHTAHMVKFVIWLPISLPAPQAIIAKCLIRIFISPWRAGRESFALDGIQAFTLLGHAIAVIISPLPRYVIKMGCSSCPAQSAACQCHLRLPVRSRYFARAPKHGDKYDDFIAIGVDTRLSKPIFAKQMKVLKWGVGRHWGTRH